MFLCLQHLTDNSHLLKYLFRFSENLWGANFKDSQIDCVFNFVYSVTDRMAEHVTSLEHVTVTVCSFIIAASASYGIFTFVNMFRF